MKQYVLFKIFMPQYGHDKHFYIPLEDNKLELRVFKRELDNFPSDYTPKTRCSLDLKTKFTEEEVDAIIDEALKTMNSQGIPTSYVRLQDNPVVKINEPFKFIEYFYKHLHKESVRETIKSLKRDKYLWRKYLQNNEDEPCQDEFARLTFPDGRHTDFFAKLFFRKHQVHPAIR